MQYGLCSPTSRHSGEVKITAVFQIIKLPCQQFPSGPEGVKGSTRTTGIYFNLKVEESSSDICGGCHHQQK